MFGKSYNIYRKFWLFGGFYFAVFELFSVKIKTKIIILVIILCFIFFLCLRIDLVPKKNIIPKVQVKFCRAQILDLEE